ncbi:DUF302 domain-containing protein [Prolixibacter denitrificans]|uniref:Uncharacterized protein (DUF302 family) n=1 Tax=Prolixibacter denitrificans TaxID=1541063 RepID=A0A2P8CBT1_9BACT|nr:DUF302 domain-containing protein [Prolixibacter denitrificans]PSK82372.1 uncharacterized protein (DUF302 family) [Prolixibacter denitrificans]GET22882.1 hypothetical protein JCM18694_31280 [Prolixibacter denitrificans]
MKYYIDKKINGSFDEVISQVTEALQKEGFGVLTEIDIQQKLKEKVDIDFRKYKILGACNPPYAYQALESEDKIGTMLPCNVVVQELESGEIEVAAVNPVASMQAVENDDLVCISTEILRKLERVIASL